MSGWNEAMIAYMRGEKPPAPSWLDKYCSIAPADATAVRSVQSSISFKPAPSLEPYSPLMDKSKPDYTIFERDVLPKIPVGLIAGEMLRRRAIKNGDLPSPAQPKLRMLTPWNLIEMQLRTQEPSLYKPDSIKKNSL